MPVDLKPLEGRLKSILYRFLEDLRATKAALYLSQDGNPYELIASYGLTEGIRRQVKGNDPMVERLILRRMPFFVNDANEEPRFHEILYHGDSARLMVLPFFVGNQLVGFLDIRDKASDEPFIPKDIDKAGPIVADFATALREAGFFGSVKRPAAADRPQTAGAQPDAQASIQHAKQAVSRELQTAGTRPKILTEQEIAPVEGILQLLLNVPGVVLAAFSAFGHLGNIQPMAARAQLTRDAVDKFNQKLSSWVRKQGMPVDSEATRTKMLDPRGETGVPVDANQLASILSAPVNVGTIQGLVLSVAFEKSPDREIQMALASYLEQIRQTLELSIAHQAVRGLRQKAADKLIEPDFQKFPELRDHSQRVSSLADQLAQYIGLGSERVEMVRLAGLVHDAGMRLLDYHRLYRKRDLEPDELAMIREHPVVGAALIADSPLGEEIAWIVLCHQEHFDGRGYPNGLRGDQIPLASRILAICEAFDAMTAVESYQPRMPESAALLQISRSAGAQFDPELAQKFVAMLGGV